MNRLVFAVFVFAIDFLRAGENVHSTVCLNMIVKNESHIIRRCLQSVKPFIDYWVIVDTGSTDGTQEIIKEFMSDIPGELHEQPWKNFADNRNEALSLAKRKSEYIIFIDADDALVLSADFVKPQLDCDAYYIKIAYSDMEYMRVQLVKSDLDWLWKGAIHEVLLTTEARSLDVLKNVTMVILGGGDRSQDPRKFQKDAELLEKIVREDPDNARHVFYLAQSYRDANMPELAMQNYAKRAAMKGWDEEVFWSLYQRALLQENSQFPEETIVDGYVDAFYHRPIRVEPLYRLCSYYRRKKNISWATLLQILHSISKNPQTFYL